MSIDTHLDGDPQSVRATATWLRDRFASKINVTADAMYASRNNFESAWEGPASDAACGRIKHGAGRALEMATAAHAYAAKIDSFASDLESAQSKMAAVRTNARAAGLTVADDVVLDSYDSDELAAAYETAAHDAGFANQLHILAAETVKNAWADVKGRWFFLVADLLSAIGEAAVEVHVSLMTKRADVLMRDSQRYLDLAHSAPPGTPAAQVYRDFDWSRTVGRQSAELLAAAESLESKATKVASKVGVGLAVAGVAYDIYTGKPVGQAVVSGGLGFGASVAAGAAIGTAIPIPIVGTIAGAGLGAVVGIFTSGAVDAMYTDGMGDVGGAIGAGASAVGDTGSAIGELATGAWDAIF